MWSISHTRVRRECHRIRTAIICGACNGASRSHGAYAPASGGLVFELLAERNGMRHDLVQPLHIELALTGQKMTGAIIILISEMKPSPSGLSATPALGKKWPMIMPTAMASRT